MQTRERWMIALAVIGFVVAVVAVVIAVDARNQTVSNDELSSQVQSELAHARTTQARTNQAQHAAAAHANQQGAQANRKASPKAGAPAKLQKATKQQGKQISSLQDQTQSIQNRQK